MLFHNLLHAPVVNAATARYWCLYAETVSKSTASGDYYWEAYEIKFFDSNSENIAVLGTAFANYSLASHDPYYANNGSDSGGTWASGAAAIHPYWGIDFGIGNAKRVIDIAVVPKNYSYLPSTVSLRKSNDQENWSIVSYFNL